MRRANNGLSMGLTVLMAQCGLYMLIFYVASLIFALITAWRAGRDVFVRVVIFGIMIAFNLVISTFQYDPTTLLFISCGYAYRSLASSTQRSEAKLPAKAYTRI